jgi:hypothetical protein
VEKPRDVIVLLAPTKTSTMSHDQMGDSENATHLYSFLQKFREDQKDSLVTGSF